MASASPEIECGHCLQKADAIVDPRVLPCSHIHCMQCLKCHYEENKLFRCGIQSCGKVYKMSPDSMPSFGVDPERLCDTCVKRGQQKRPAVSYCTNCSRKFCKEHLEQHDGLLDGHQTISMAEFLAQEDKPQVETCTKHTNMPCIMGCKTCHTIICVKCLADSSKCDDGAPHDFLALEDLAAALFTDNVTAESRVRDAQYERLFKDVTKLQADYDEETAAMLELIHQTRESHLREVKLKYDTLEQHVLEKRAESQTKISDFVEDELLRQWNSLRAHKELLESKAKKSSPAAVVRGFKDLKEQLNKIAREKLPSLELGSQLRLLKRDERRDIELEIISSDLIIIGKQTAPSIQLPKSLTKLSTVEVPDTLLSICHRKGNTYVGLVNNTVSILDSNYTVSNNFISTSGGVESVTCHKDRLYTLSLTHPRTVGVYNMSGELITSWKHPYHDHWSDMLVVVDNKVLIADPVNRRITAYSLNGETLHHVPCPHITDNDSVTMCACDSNSLIVSSLINSKVFKVDVTSQEVLWTLTDVENPRGLVSYGKYILLAADEDETIYIINSTTGCIVSQMAAEAIGRDVVWSLEVSGSTLLIPEHISQQVIIYQMD